MSEANDSFEKDLEQLIRLFKKIKNKTATDRFNQIDPALTQNLDFIINNYEMMKGNISKDMLNQMGFPFQKMMHEFITQMKQELGEEFDDFDLDDEEPVDEPPKEAIENPKPLSNDIAEIDARLRKPGLSDAEIDALLDKRNQLLNEGN